jgi:hypothetical protein
MEMTSEVKMPVVAYLVGGLRSGEPSLCFEDERGDYGSEDETPKFDALVLQSDALAAIEAARVEARAKALEEAAAISDAERAEFAEQAARTDGRHSDMAFGSVNSAERISDRIRSRAKEGP